MDCAQMRRWMLDGGDPTAAEPRHHMEECPACKSLYADGAELALLLAAEPAGQPATSLPSFAEIEGRIGKERGWWQRLAEMSTGARSAVALVAVAVPVLLGLLRHRANLAAYPPGRLAIELAAMAGLVLVSIWFWLRPLYRPQPSHRILWGVLALALTLPWAMALFPAALAVSAEHATGELRRAASCFIYGTLTAAPALVLVAGLGRRGTGFPGFALLPAAAAALAGLLGLHLHCPEVSPVHLLLGHAPIALVLPLLLALVGRLRRGRLTG
jgi:hypothetical protein